MKFDIIQIGSHIGNTPNDYIFNKINQSNNVIFIEPVKEYFHKLKENYDKKFPNNNFIFLNVACGDQDDYIKLYVPIINPNLPYWADQLSSVLPNHTKDHNLLVNLDEQVVESITLNTLLKNYDIKELELLCVDTEGYDFEILNSYDFNIKPKEIIFEHKHMDGTNKSFGERYNILMNKLINHGYSLVKQIGDDTHMILNIT